VAAAILVTTLNFGDTMALPFVLVASIILPLILIPTAKRLGGRGASTAPQSVQANVTQPTPAAPVESIPESR
jgi:hypothetical protein